MAPPAKEKSGNHWILKLLIKAIKVTAPKVAPPVTPIISGEAIGFFKTFCKIKPLAPNAAPATIARVIRVAAKLQA